MRKSIFNVIALKDGGRRKPEFFKVTALKDGGCVRQFLMLLPLKTKDA